jgi:hypothetical protein
MCAISKLGKIVIRLFWSRICGARLHAIYGDRELVVSLPGLRIIQSEVPLWVEQTVLDWAVEHRQELLAAGDRSRRFSLMPSY